MSAGLATDGWKETLAHYHDAASALARSMSVHGYDYKWPVPLDRRGELRGGAHRVACALVLGIHAAPCEYLMGEDVVATGFPPPWDYDWFVKAGLDKASLNRLVGDFEALRRDN